MAANNELTIFDNDSDRLTVIPTKHKVIFKITPSGTHVDDGSTVELSIDDVVRLISFLRTTQ